MNLKKIIKKIIDKNYLITYVENPTKISRKAIFFDGGYIFLNILHDKDFDKNLNELIQITFENKLHIYALLGNIVYISNYTSDEFNKDNYNKFLNFEKLVPNHLKSKIRYIIGKTTIRAQRFGKDNTMKYMPQIIDVFSKIILLKDIEFGEYKEIEEN